MAEPARVTIPYAPRGPFLPYHTRKQRWSVIVAHRRAGKTVACVNELLKCALTNPRTDPPPRYGYIAPHFNQAKDVAWEYLKKYAAPVLQYGGSVNESELRVDLPNGGRVRLYGADNADRLRGLYFDGVILDEFADMDPRIVEVIRPTLSDHIGWCTWIGTPKGHNEFYNVWKGKPDDDQNEWLKLMLKASQTGLLDARELEAAKRDLSKDKYEQEYECSFDAAIQGAYYGPEMADADKDKRITRVPYDKAVDVITAWDLGIGDATSIWFCQQVGQEIHLIDYVENAGVGLDWYAKELKNRPYVYGEHILPHDAEAKELGTGKTRREVLEALGIKSVIAPKLAVDDGINAARNIISRCWFDAEKCARGIEALKQYRTEWDEKGKVFRRKPLHDWCFSPETVILTRSGMCQIMNLPQSGEVLTSCGWKRYTNPRITRKNAQLVEVLFTDGHMVRCTPDHLFKTESGWKSAESLTKGTLIQSGLIHLRNTLLADCTGYTLATAILRKVARNFTEKFGKVLSEPFPMDAISITGMALRQTTAFKISNVFPQGSIYRKNGQSPGLALTSTLAKTLGIEPLNGTVLKPEGFGTKDMPSDLRDGLNGSAKKSPAKGAAFRLMRWLGQEMRRSFAVLTAKPLCIESVRRTHLTSDVWCLTAPYAEEFSLANGAIVHNCSHAADAFRYLAVGMKNTPKGQWTEEVMDFKIDWVA